MKRVTNRVIILGMMLTTSIHADSWYIGLEQSLINNIDNTIEVDGYDYHNDKSSNITSFKIGKILGDDSKTANHFEFVYNMGEKSANNIVDNETLLSLSFNWNITVPSLIPDDDFTPYIRLGLNYSMSDNQYNISGTSDSGNYSAYGLILGLGSYFSLNEKVNLLAGFDYQYRWWDTLSSYYYGDIDSTDTIKKLYVGAEYLF